VKNLISVSVSFFLGLGACAVHAATVAAADAGMVQTAKLAGEIANIDKDIFQVSQTFDFGGANIFWVLGGGLVALSLVARRISR